MKWIGAAFIADVAAMLTNAGLQYSVFSLLTGCQKKDFLSNTFTPCYKLLFCLEVFSFFLQETAGNNSVLSTAKTVIILTLHETVIYSLT